MSPDELQQDTPRLGREQRYAAYQKKLRDLKDRSSLREVMEREILLEFVRINHSSINEFPLLKAQQNSVIELMCNRGQHPGYDFIQRLTNNFMTMVTRYDKARANMDEDGMQTTGKQLHNNEVLLIKCIQGIVYGMALITDNFEEIVLRYFGQGSLNDYSALIEKHELDKNFWVAFVQHFVASRVEAAHKEIIASRKYTLSKEKNSLIIRFLLDDVLSQLNPTTAKIDKTKLQKTYELSGAGFEDRRTAKIVQTTLTKGLSFMPEGFLQPRDYLNAARVVCIDSVAKDFAREYMNRVMKTKSGEQPAPEPESENPETDNAESGEMNFEFLLNQIVALGVGATLAIGMTSRNFFTALEGFIPGATKPIEPMMRNFNTNALEAVLFYMLEHYFTYILQEIGLDEGSKITVRSTRSRRANSAAVNELTGLNKIRKSKLFATDSSREGSLLFIPKTQKQLAQFAEALQLEDALKEQLVELWTKGVSRVDIMVMINLQQVARTSTNLSVRLGEILTKYGVSAPGKTPEPEEEPQSQNGNDGNGEDQKEVKAG